MKKILLFASALAGLFLAGSCQKENLEPAAQGGVTYEISLPTGPQTKGEEGYDTYDLYYEVYKTVDASELAALAQPLFEDKVIMTGDTYTLQLDLLNDQDYTILFWANKKDGADFNLTDLRQVGVNIPIAANNDDRDAFCGMDQLVQHDGAQSKTVTLTRPFAQVNVATLVPTAAEIGYDVTPTHSYVRVSSIPMTFNVFTGRPADNTVAAVEFSTADAPAEIPVDDITVNGTAYNWVAMNYILVPESVVEVYYEITTANGVVKNTISNVPVKKNYRTNIIGNLLTSNATYTIEVKPGFEEGDLAPDPLYLAAAIGGEVTLTEDVVLAEPLEVKAKMTINLNGKTITAGIKEEGRHHYAIDNYGVLTLVGTGAINARGVQNFGTMVIDGDITITNLDTNGGSAIWNEGDLVINNGTFTTNPNAGAGSYGGALSTQTGGSAVINGGNFKSYSQFTYAICNYGETIINDATVTGRHGAVASTLGCETVINAGSFSLLENQGVSDHCVYYVSSIKGGSFTLGNNTDSGAQVFYESTIANGYKAIQDGNVWVVVTAETTVASTKEQLADVFANGGTVILADDIEFEKITSIEPGKEVYLNLNGKKITVDQNTTSNTLIYVKDGAKLIIDGNGTIDLGSVSTMAVFAPYGELVIENGTFIRDKVTTVTKETTGLFMGAKTTASNVTINGGYFDAGYYNTDAAYIEDFLAGTKQLEETADDIAKRGNSKDANKVRIALKDNISCVLNHSGHGSFKIYGGTFVGANPAWGDEGCMLPTTPNYLRPWSYYQGALLDGQTFNENGLVIPAGYEITKGVTDNGIPTYTVTYNK